MTITQNKTLEKVYQYLFILSIFFMPFSRAGVNIFVYTLVIIWLFSGNYTIKFKEILQNKVVITSILFYVFHVIGLLWTNNLQEGIGLTSQMKAFILVLPVLITIAQKEYIKYYIGAFLLSMSILELLSYLTFFDIINPINTATKYDPSPISHIVYNPLLAFAIYITLNKLLFVKNNSKWTIYIYPFFALTMSINMFITGGRAGQVMYFAMLIILLFQYFNKNILKAFILSILILPTIFISAYSTSEIFKNRVNLAVDNIQNYENDKNTSVGLRLTFAINSLEIIKNNPIIGVGAGDFNDEYKKINNINSPESKIFKNNPHNMYILKTTQLGVIGLFLMLLILYQQLYFSKSIKNQFIKNIAIMLPIMFLIIMWSDIYLFKTTTQNLFILLSAFLYKNYEKS